MVDALRRGPAAEPMGCVDRAFRLEPFKCRDNDKVGAALHHSRRGPHLPTPGRGPGRSARTRLSLLTETPAYTLVSSPVLPALLSGCEADTRCGARADPTARDGRHGRSAGEGPLVARVLRAAEVVAVRAMEAVLAQRLADRKNQRTGGYR